MHRFLLIEAVLSAIAGGIALLGLPSSGWRPRPSFRRLAQRIAREFDGATPRQRIAWLAIVMVALTIRGYHMLQTMRGDEAYTFLRYASLPLSRALSEYSDPNNHFFHTLLVHLSTRLFGTSPPAIRLPAFVAGMLIVPAVYIVARRFADRDASLLAMGLAAVWPALILYSTNARGHAIVALLFLALVVVADEAADRDGSWWWLLAAALIALGTYTAPIMLYPAGAAMLWIVVERAQRAGRAAARNMVARVVVVAALAAVLAAMALLPVVLRNGGGVFMEDRHLAPLPIGQLVAALPVFASELLESHGFGIPRALLVLLALAGVAGIGAPGPNRGARARLAVSVMLWCAALLAVTRRLPPGRAWHFLVPLACVYIAIGTSLAAERLGHSLRRRPAHPTFAATAVLMVVIAGYAMRTRAVFRSPESGTLVDAPQIAEYLLATMRRGDAIAAASPCVLPLDYYLFRRGGRRIDAINAEAGRGRMFVVVNPRHLQTLAKVQRVRWKFPWPEMVQDAPPVSFEPESVFVFRYAPRS